MSYKDVLQLGNIEALTDPMMRPKLKPQVLTTAEIARPPTGYGAIGPASSLVDTAIANDYYPDSGGALMSPPDSRDWLYNESGEIIRPESKGRRWLRRLGKKVWLFFRFCTCLTLLDDDNGKIPQEG